MKTEQLTEIVRHGYNLNRIFNTGLDPVELCKKLRRLENKAHYAAEQYCNGAIDSDQWETVVDRTLRSLDKIIGFNKKQIQVFVNGDPRGYALKISEEYVREHNLQIHKDWGGYGILAPEINEKGE